MSSSFDKVVKMWDTETGAVLRTLGEGKMFYTAKFHPEKQTTVVAGCADKKIYQWDSETGDLVQVGQITVFACGLDSCLASTSWNGLMVTYVLNKVLQPSCLAMQYQWHIVLQFGRTPRLQKTEQSVDAAA